MLTPYLPFPLLSGGQTRSYNLIKNLSQKHEVTLFSLIKDEKEKQFVGELEKFCRKVAVFKRSKTPWTLRNLALTAFGPYPFLVIRNLVSQERKIIEKELDSKKYDLIHAETFYVMPHLPKTSVPVLLVEQTIEYLVYKHYMEEQAPFYLRPFLWLDVFKLKFWESYFWREAKKVVVVSEADHQEMDKLVPGLDIEIVPNGIDQAYFSVKKRQTSDVPRVLYVGNFAWLQNVEAVEILVNQVWPKLKRAIPRAKLWIVGMNINNYIRGLASTDIEITECIPDIRDAYQAASVLVTPIKGPGGTRLKILEAMASGLPVVTTSVGAEGLGVTDNKEVLIRDNFSDLAEAAILVLKDQSLAKSLGIRGKRFVELNYTWKQSARKLDEIYEEVIQQA